MVDPGALRERVLRQLAGVIDPETGLDVVRMRLFEALVVSEYGHVAYTFRPSSPFCPLGFALAQMIHTAVGTTPGVTGQTITVTGHMRAQELTQLLNAAR